MTERIYYEHAYQTECESMVIECGQRNGYPALQLNRTVFYPTSGGQPNDTGQIASEAVVDVIVGDDGNVWHLLTENASIPTVGQTVDCIIDWDRRYDHMQQHTGQHLISQVFYQLLGYETVSVHFGETESTLDLEVPTIEFAQLDEADEELCL